MKTTHLFSASLACVLLAVQSLAASDAVAGWNTELALAQQAYNQSADGRARADAMLGTILAEVASGRSTEAPPAGANLQAATAQAAYSALSVLYPGRLPALDAELADSLAAIVDTPAAISAGREWGRHVAGMNLAERQDVVSLNASSVRAEASPAVSLPPSSELASPGRYRYSVLAGTPGTTGSADGVGAAARFGRPAGIAVDAAGNVYVSEKNLCVIRKITPDGVVTTLAGAAGEKGSQDGAGPVARFNNPQGLAVDAGGNVYVADTGNNVIRKIAPSGLVRTLAGLAGSTGLQGPGDGVGTAARFYTPLYLAVDGAGVVYVAELNASRIRKIMPDGTVSSPAIDLPSYYSVYQGGIPLCGFAVDHAGILYAAYCNNYDISDVLQFTPASGGKYTTSFLKFPTGFTPGWGDPICVAVDDADNLYIKYDADPIFRFTPEGDAQVYYGSGSSGGYGWSGMSVGTLGKLFAIPSAAYPEKAGAIEIGIFDRAATGITIVRQPFDSTFEIHRDDTAFVRFEVEATGASALSYQWLFNGNPIPGVTSSVYQFKTNTQAGDAGLYSVIISDSTGSLTSRAARLVVNEMPSAKSGGDGKSPDGDKSTGPSSSGGGSFDAQISFAVLALLAAAAGRRFRRTEEWRAPVISKLPPVGLAVERSGHE